MAYNPDIPTIRTLHDSCFLAEKLMSEPDPEPWLYDVRLADTGTNRSIIIIYDFNSTFRGYL